MVFQEEIVVKIKEDESLKIYKKPPNDLELPCPFDNSKKVRLILGKIEPLERSVYKTKVAIYKCVEGKKCTNKFKDHCPFLNINLSPLKEAILTPPMWDKEEHLFFYCPKCKGYINHPPVAKHVNTMGTSPLAGYKGWEYRCARCGTTIYERIYAYS